MLYAQGLALSGGSVAAALHAVTSGTVWLGLPGQPPLQLMPGDVVLLPDGTEHALGSDPEAVSRTSAHHFDACHGTDSGVVRIDMTNGVFAVRRPRIQ